MTWVPIERTSVDIIDVDAGHHLLTVRVGLSSTPTQAWADAFREAARVEVPDWLEPARVVGDVVELRTLDHELHRRGMDVDRRIREANERYERDVVTAGR